jgi:hypothetical protein
MRLSTFFVAGAMAAMSAVPAFARMSRSSISANLNLAGVQVDQMSMANSGNVTNVSGGNASADVLSGGAASMNESAVTVSSTSRTHSSSHGLTISANGALVGVEQMSSANSGNTTNVTGSSSSSRHHSSSSTATALVTSSDAVSGNSSVVNVTKSGF